MLKIIQSGWIVRASVIVANLGIFGTLAAIATNGAPIEQKVYPVASILIGWMVIVGTGVAMQKSAEVGYARHSERAAAKRRAATRTMERLNGRCWVPRL